jgi:hypothetical protein
MKEAYERSRHRYAETVRRSLHDGFNGFLRALLGDRAFVVTVIGAMQSIVANLTPASGRLVPAFQSSFTFAAPSLTNLGKQRALANLKFRCGFRFEVPVRTRGNLRIDFKSAALVPHEFAVRSRRHSSSDAVTSITSRTNVRDDR